MPPVLDVLVLEAYTLRGCRAGDERLSSTARSATAAEDDSALISAASAWKIIRRQRYRD